MNLKIVKLGILVIMKVLPILSQSLHAQMTENCEVLNFVLNNEEIQRAFFLDKKTGEAIVISDRVHFNWEQCKVDLASGRKVFFQKDTLFTEKKDVLHIVLYDLKSHGPYFTAHLHQKEKNAYAKIEVRKRRRSMKVLSIEISYF